jgi:hypothetical protein
VFEETNKLNEGDLVTDLFIPHPENVQFYHVQNIRDHLAGKVTHLQMVLRQVIPLGLWIKLLKYIKETCSNK